MSRGWGKRRKTGIREEKKKIFIFTEGKNTEESYFKSFRLTNCLVHITGDLGNTTSVVEEAERRIKNSDYERSKDQLWCVFDKDSFTSEKFDNAINSAKSKGFKVAWSNQAFEYWLLPHFEDHQGGGMHRSTYTNKINSYIQEEKAKYDLRGNKTISTKFFGLLDEIPAGKSESRVKTAIKRAKRIHNSRSNEAPSGCESCTTVYELVEVILNERNEYF